MFKKLSTVKAMIGGTCFLAAQAIMASTPMTTCPSIDMLKAFDHGKIRSVTPVTFDVQAHTMVFSIYASTVFSENDPVFPDYGRADLSLTGIALPKDHDMKEEIAATLDKMHVDFETPIQYKPFLDDNLQLLVCTYSSPSGDLKAVVSQEISSRVAKEK